MIVIVAARSCFGQRQRIDSQEAHFDASTGGLEADAYRGGFPAPVIMMSLPLRLRSSGLEDISGLCPEGILPNDSGDVPVKLYKDTGSRIVSRGPSPIKKLLPDLLNWKELSVP